jgi:uncharacterized repeat protein (TIGR01451 family)
MTSRPNIVFIVADDMGYGDFGCFNYGASQTPALDHLIHEGVSLTQHYSASPVCAPARASLLTGRYPHRTGAIDTLELRGLDRMALREHTVADYLGAAGYSTGLAGKWHNGSLDPRYHPNQRGFLEFVGFSGGWSPYVDYHLDTNGHVSKSDGRYITDVFTDEAVQFIRRHAREPFALMLAYSAPHYPFHALGEDLAPFRETGAFTTAVSHIYGMIRGVGRVLDELERQGLAENTLVIFTSDNGPQLGGHGESDSTRFSKSGGTVIASVLSNDTLNGRPATTAAVQLSLASAPVQGITMNLSTGAVSVAPKTASGLYNLAYRICEVASLINCDAATITLNLSGGGGGSGSGGSTTLATATPVSVVVAGGDPTSLPTATATASLGGSGSTALPDIQVSGSASTGSPLHGTQFSYTFKVKNSGSVGSTNVAITDPLPAQLPPASYVSGTTSDGTLCVPASLDGGATLNVTCGLGALAAGVEKAVTILVTAPSAPATVVNTATATSSNGDANPGNDSRSVTVAVK